jgi:hypothetical protein
MNKVKRGTCFTNIGGFQIEGFGDHLLKDLEILIRMMMLFDDKKMENFEDMMVLYSVISRSRYIFI